MRVIQFIHPGFEYQFRTSQHGVMPWKDGNSGHNRKFLLAHGSLTNLNDAPAHTDEPIVFWGEWEGPSVYWRVESAGKPLPSFIHAPFRPTCWPARSVQNTDPMVFGDSFVYSNCLQAAFRSLRLLPPGSIILFGRHGRQNREYSFQLDTCLVVDQVHQRTPGGDSWGGDVVSDAVLRPLYSENPNQQLTVYFGKSGPTPPFSFFPAQLYMGTGSLFARPVLCPTGPLVDILSPRKNQGIKRSGELTVVERDAIWAEVAHQVASQGCSLGYRASLPPVLADRIALAASTGPPRPLTTDTR